MDRYQIWRLILDPRGKTPFSCRKNSASPQFVLVTVDQSQPAGLDDVIRNTNRAPIVVVIG